MDDVLAAATTRMTSGELVHGATFDLFASMSAITVGDRKMDVGVEGGMDGLAPPFQTSEKLVAAGRAPLELTDEEQIYVFDALLACEATWHSGQSLAVSIYTCLYMHDFDRLEASSSPVTRAYFDAVRSDVATVRNAVSLGDVWEEEDFNAHVAGYDVGAAAMGDPTKPDETLRALKAAERWLTSTRAGGATTDALLTRVRFRIALHCALRDMIKADVTADDAANARKKLTLAATLLESMRASTRAPPSSGDANDEKTDFGEAFRGGKLDWNTRGLGFDRDVNARRLGPHPPRVVKPFSRAGAFDHFASFVGELLRACDVLDLRVRGDVALHELIAMLSTISDAKPGIVARSFIAAIVLRDGQGTVMGRRSGDCVLRSAWLCGSAPPPAIDLTTIEVDDDLGGTGDSGEGSGGKSGGGEEEDAALKVFLAKVWRPVDFLLRAYCSNRSRLRRRARRCLGEWNLLVEPAIAADDSGAIERYLDAYAETNDCDAARALARSAWPKSAMARWTISMMARVEITHLSLGHELELYLPHELGMIYWYTEYLMHNLCDHLDSANACLIEEANAWKRQRAERPLEKREKDGKKAKKEKRGGKAGGDAAAFEGDGGAAQLRVQMEHFVLEFQKTMCGGLVTLITAMDKVGKVKRPTAGSDFTDPEQNFWQRFGFMHACADPGPLTYQEYHDYVNTPHTPHEMLTAAAKYFAEVSRKTKQLTATGLIPPGSTQAADVSGVMTCAVANATACKLAAMPGMAVELTHKHHPSFATAVVKREGGDKS